MSELPDLPPVVRRTRPLPAGGLEAAMAAGARRRNRVLAVAGGTTTALVLVVAATVALPGGGTDSLGVADRPSPAPSATASPEQAPQEEPPAPADTPAPSVPTPVPSAVAPTPRQDAVVPPVTGPAPGGGSDATAPGRAPRPATPPAQPTAAPAQPTAAPAPPAAARPAYREDTDEDAPGTAICSGATLGSCTHGTNSGRVARRGEQVRLSHIDCSGRGGTDVIYSFAGGQEKELVVTRDGQEVFRFSSTVRYVEGAHQRRLRGGRCIEWTGRWDQITTDGQPVPAGTYTVRLTVEADRVEPEGVPQEGRPYRQTDSFNVTIAE